MSLDRAKQSNQRRRKSNEVSIGGVHIGADNPIAVQSMLNTSTLDTEGCVAQIELLVEAGCRIVRLAVPTSRDVDNLPNIINKLRQRGILAGKGAHWSGQQMEWRSEVAIVADVHFNSELAMKAALYVDKVRINPGNYSDPDGTKFIALIERCRERGVALRIGVNHGSLAPHIVERWGDTPRGMVESAMGLLRVCQSVEFDQVVVSIKASNVRIMVQAYRDLVAQMETEQMHYPLHLGVTEAGSDMEGRVKSAVGVGALLVEGIGDTIRVSLTEPPQNEIPVAQSIIKYIEESESRFHRSAKHNYLRRSSLRVGNVGGEAVPLLYSELDQEAMAGVESGAVVVMLAESSNSSAQWRERIEAMDAQGDNRPVILHRQYSNDISPEQLQIVTAIDFGAPLIDALADGIWIDSTLPVDELGLSVFQATRTRMSRTEFIACPGCARTLFDLERTLAQVKGRMSHLHGLKIAIMGCIVNGPGEMADADYGYVGEGAGRVTLYKNREIVRRSIAESEAIETLIEVIKEGGQWVDKIETER